MNTLDIRDSDMQKYFDKQFDRGMQPVSIAAHMLHPIYRGEVLRFLNDWCNFKSIF